MTTLREAATMALEALGSLLYPQPRQMAAIAALRAALAEPRPIHECYGDCPTNPQTCPNPCNFEGRPRPVQEPVAWLFTNLQSGDYDFCYQEDEHDHDLEMWHKQPLYTAPPQRKPLTDEEIVGLSDLRGGCYGTTDFARAIERAHGIKE